MFQNLLAFHLGNFAHDLISYWNFSAVPRDSQGLGKLGPPPSHFSACVELTLLCLMPSAMLALNITLLTDFICLPTQLAIAQLSAYMLQQHCETPNVECKTFGELHSHRPINHPCRPGDVLCSS